MRTAPLLAAFLALVAAPGGARQASDPAPVAVVYSLAGEAAVVLPAGERRPLRLFDRLPAGTVMETGPGARLALAFADGRRYELGEHSRATLGPADLRSRSGDVRALPSVPPLPRLEPIADEDHPGFRAGAVRIRGETLSGLYSEAVTAPPPQAPRVSTGEPHVAAALVRIERRAQERSEKGAAVVWLLAEATALDRARQGPRADAFYGAAVDHAASLGEEESVARILHAWGKSLQQRGSWAQTEDLYRRALDLDRAAGRELAAAESLHDLGTMKAQRGDLPAAEDLLRQALAIREKLAPGSAALARTLANLGNVRMLQEDLAAAEDCLRRALSIQEAIDPEGRETARVLANLGNAASARGDLAAAEAFYRRARGILEKTGPRTLEMAKVLKNLGVAAAHRQEPETADFYLRRALAIEEALDPSGAGLAMTLDSLALQLSSRGEVEKSLEYLRRAIGLKEGLLPDSPGLAKSLQNLGAILAGAGDCAGAEAPLRRALAIRQNRNPGGLDHGESLASLGHHALACKDPAAAEDFYSRALAIFLEREPSGLGPALALRGLGQVRARQGRLPAAAEHFCRAADLAGSWWDEAGSRAGHDEVYFRDCAAAQAEAGQPADAFLALERGRSRVLLREIGERDHLAAAALPEDVARRRKELARELESTQAALARLDPRQDPEAARRLLDRLRELRDRRQELAEQIRRSGLRVSALDPPQALDLQGARRALDPGTVLLAYLVDDEKTFLFVVSPAASSGPGVAVYTVPAGAQELAKRVRSLRELSRQAGSDLGELQTVAADLYDLLLAPAEAEITAARRLLISPDRSLHTLPFAGLVRRGHYLAAWKPVHSVLSATVYAELKRTRRATDFARSELVAFGDPVYPRGGRNRDSAPAGTLEILTAVRRGLSLDPIPASRAEVEGIAALFPRARIYLGSEATEERAKSLSTEARLIHFATHGLLDGRFPLHSALALTMPREPGEGQENGLLQAWEILDSVRLDADLVTLSACETALGHDKGGEGLIGLTRAFQYAGARSVLASLWSVADVSTADFMQRFYGHLRAGKAKDEALQAAQAELIGSSGFSHPYHWAAFQLSGDWR